MVDSETVTRHGDPRVLRTEDRTEDLHGMGRVLSLPIILVALGNTSLLCAVQKSLACHSFATGGRAKTGSDCLKTAMYVVDVISRPLLSSNSLRVAMPLSPVADLFAHHPILSFPFVA